MDRLLLEGDGTIDNKTDIKIFILYLLDNINNFLDYNAILDIIVESGYIRPFEFAECFSELKDLGHIIEDTLDGESYYMISESGRMVARELQDHILSSIREKSSKVAIRYASLYHRGINLQSSVSVLENKRAVLQAKMTDNSGELFTFNMRFPTQELAKKAKKSFDQKPDIVFRSFMSMITGELDYLMD